MKTLLFIYNPHAGKGTITTRLNDVVSVFQSAGYLVTLYATSGVGDGVYAGRTLSAGYDRVVCSGGDGTLSEVITGLMDSDYCGALGYIPAGTTNDFSHMLGLSTDMAASARIAVSGTEQAVDVGLFNTHKFIYVAAFGLFTAVSYETPQEFKSLFGHLAYVLAGMKSLADVTPYHCTVAYDGTTIEGDFIYAMVSDSTSVGGFQGLKTSEVVLDDGLFEVVLVKQPKTLLDLSAISGALLRREPNDYVIGVQANHIVFTSVEEIPWTLDGERGGEHCVADIRNLSKGITMLKGVIDG